jgi:hypothetical protein
MPRHIGTLAEKSLHVALKALYAQPGDSLEYDLDGYVIDIVRPSPDTSDTHHCIEIQTRNLAKLKPKLLALLDRHWIQVVYPIAQERFIVRIDANGAVRSQRKSPKHGTIIHLFPELVSFPGLVSHPHFSLEVLLIREEELWCDDGRGSWRRKHWSIQDRRLLTVMGSVPLTGPQDYAALLPADLPSLFDSQDLAAALAQPRYLAQKMLYCLRAMGVLQVTGKRGNAVVYCRTR